MSTKVSRNDPCPCGSKRKYKQCCIHKESRAAKHTAEGKLKFSATVLQQEGAKDFSSLFQRVAASLSTSQGSEATEQFNHYISKNKAGLGKRAIRSMKAKEDREISKKLHQHSFEKMDVSL